MRTCRTCGKSIEHKRADAKHCDDDCRARWGQGLMAKPPSDPPDKDPPLKTDPVFSDLAAALGRAEAVVSAPIAAVAPTRVATGSLETPRPPRQPPVVTRPPDQHLREPNLDAAALEKRLFDLELRMNAYDMDQPWQDWYDDAKKLVDEAKKLIERAKTTDAGLRERVEKLEKAQAEVPNMTKIRTLIEEKLKHLWAEIDKVDKATASRQALEKLAEQVTALTERRPDARTAGGPAGTGGEALKHVHERIDGAIEAHNWLQRKFVSTTTEFTAALGRLAGVQEDDE